MVSTSHLFSRRIEYISSRWRHNAVRDKRYFKDIFKGPSTGTLTSIYEYIANFFMNLIMLVINEKRTLRFSEMSGYSFPKTLKLKNKWYKIVWYLLSNLEPNGRVHFNEGETSRVGVSLYNMEHKDVVDFNAHCVDMVILHATIIYFYSKQYEGN